MVETAGEKFNRLRMERPVAEQALLGGASAWAKAQRLHVRAFLLEEARLTVITQSTRTAQIPEMVPDIRAQIQSICNEGDIVFTSWAKAATVASSAAAASDLKKTFCLLVSPLHRSFGDAMISYGYHADESGVGGQSGLPWKFYDPRTGTARTGRIPMDREADTEFNTLARAYEDLVRGIGAAKESMQRDAAARLWDS